LFQGILPYIRSKRQASIWTERYAGPGGILAKIAGRTPIKAGGEDLLTL